ncbi:hypothetical protein [Streptomyces sp. MK7]
MPVVVTYIGYSGGRGLPTDHLFWSAACSVPWRA